MAMIPAPRSAFIEIAGSRLHYAAHGDPAAPPLVLVHGMRDHARSWDWIAAALADRWHVIAPDLRGHGDSFHAGASGYGLAAFVLDLADLIDALALATVALVGHSLGGAIALRYAAAFPERVRTLCVIEGIELPIVRDERATPTPHPERVRRWAMLERARRERTPRRYASVAEAEHRFAAAHPDYDGETVSHLVRHGLIRGADGAWRWKYDNAARFRAPDDADGGYLDQTLAAIACPTLLAYGETSWIAPPPRARLALLRDHRLVMFSKASHWLHHQSRAPFLAALTPFLDEQPKGHRHA